MTDAVVTALREIANRDLYQRNAFHLTGLAANVDRRATRQRQQHVVAVLEAGADLETTGSTDPDQLRTAFDRLLGDPRLRLVDEVFGFWGAPDADCGCEEAVHDLHDKAVHAHAAAIEAFVAPPSPTDQRPIHIWWRVADSRWRSTIENPQFWQHLRNRVLLLDDLQLVAGAVDRIRGELPATLTGPLVDLALSSDDPSRPASMLREWTLAGDSAEKLVLDAVRPHYERAEDAASELLRRLRGGRGQVDPVVAELDNSVVPAYRRLEVLLPAEHHQRTRALRDQIALTYNNGAIQLVNHGSLSDRRIEILFDQASDYAATTDTHALIDENRQQVHELILGEARDHSRPRPRPRRQYRFEEPTPDSGGCYTGVIAFLILAAIVFVLIRVFT